jgi:hypothetical protein
MAKYLRERGLSIASMVLVVLTMVAAFGSQQQVARADGKGSCDENCSCYGSVDKKVGCSASGCGSACNTCPASTMCTVNSQDPPPGD